MDDRGNNFSEFKFEQVQGIAKGGFAQVALITGTELVVKVASGDAHDHHIREKRIYERLGHHPYILRYQGEAKVVSAERTMVGLLLQYHPAGTLAALLSHQKFPPNADRTKWPSQAAEAVQYIHSKGVIHGDLGSHNFLVQNDGTLALADFGGSSIDGSECLEHSPARYTRPAAVSQSDLQPTKKDDLFALGTVLYEISTGQQLYEDKTETEIYNLFAGQRFPDLTPVPVPLRLVIEKCWKEEYNNAEEVSHNIREWLVSLTFPGRSIAPEESDLQWLTSPLRFSEPPSHQLSRAALFRSIGLFSTTLVVVLAIGSKRGVILRFGRLVAQVFFGTGKKP